MSVPQRLRTNFLTGTIASLPAGSTTLTFTATSNALGSITSIISGTNYLPLVINPASYGNTSTPAAEVVWVVGYSNGSTATVMRGQENTTANPNPWANNTVFVNGPLTNDFGITNQIANGDFPSPTASGQVLKATPSGGLYAPVWVSSSVPAPAITPGALASGVTISGGQVFGDLSANASISGSKVIGVPNQTIAQYTAFGTNQGSATLITTQYATVVGATSTSNGGAGKGVILPSITVSGQAVTIDNADSTHWLLIYPATGASIDGAGTNNPVWIAPSAYWYGVVENSTNWATVIPSLNSGTGVSATYGNGNITLSSALRMWSVTASDTLTISGFNSYLVLVNGYGSRTSSGYLTTVLNANGSAIVTANTYSTGGTQLYSLSNMNIYNNSSSWTATLTNTNYSNGSGFAIIIGIN